MQCACFLIKLYFSITWSTVQCCWPYPWLEGPGEYCLSLLMYNKGRFGHFKNVKFIFLLILWKVTKQNPKMPRVYHIIHSASLFASFFFFLSYSCYSCWIMCLLPRLSGSLFAGGMLIFCGTTYYHALTGDTQLRSAQVLNVTNSTGSEPQPPGGSTYLPMR